MKKYRIKKINRNLENPFSEISIFGDSREYFEGYSETPPVEGERFVLRDSLGGVVINTSSVVKIEENEFTTTYSVYSITVIDK